LFVFFVCPPPNQIHILAFLFFNSFVKKNKMAAQEKGVDLISYEGDYIK